MYYYILEGKNNAAFNFFIKAVLNHLSQCDWLVIEVMLKLYDQLKSIEIKMNKNGNE